MRSSFLGISGLVLATTTAIAQPVVVDPGVVEAIDARSGDYARLAREIWELAEVGYQETRSSARLQAVLSDAGFAIEAGLSGMPTAFVASRGTGRPVIAILAEFDALPGISQDSVPVRRQRDEVDAGHACGHHLFGTASTAAAVAVGDWLERTRTAGTIRVYGTPAEEGGSGKVYLTRDGAFADVDVALHWHPSDRNEAGPSTTLANKSGKFRFHGLSAHAASAPHRGRSALDGVEAMNYMVNMLREHVPEQTRIHYVITSGGSAPNVVPDFAEVYYYLRHPEMDVVEQLWERIIAASEGAATGTGTRVDHEVIHGNYSLLPNETLSRIVDAKLRTVGGPVYGAEELRFAEAIRATFDDADLALGTEREIQPYQFKHQKGSTDVGDVSWAVPTAGFNAATWVPGTGAHSWQAIAAGGTRIGAKGMLVAAKTLALTAVELFSDRSIIEAARTEFDRRRGPDFHYRPLLGDRDPPLDYRR